VEEHLQSSSTFLPSCPQPPSPADLANGTDSDIPIPYPLRNGIVLTFRSMEKKLGMGMSESALEAPGLRVVLLNILVVYRTFQRVHNSVATTVQP
jgi:hypothetical protein